jgi:hypothetical protein
MNRFILHRKTTALVLLGLFVASDFVPYSLGGPAMSCVTTNGAPEYIKSAVLAFISSNSADVAKVTNFALRSDFRIRNASFLSPKYSKNNPPSVNVLSLVFHSNDTNLRCLFFSLPRVLQSEPKLLILRVEPEGPNETAVVTDIIVD